MKSWMMRSAGKRFAAAVATAATLLSGAVIATANATEVTPGTAAPQVAAQANNNLQLLASWDFTGKDGTNSGVIKDSTNTYDLTLHNNVSVGKFGDRSQSEALNLDQSKTTNASGYAEIDKNLFKAAGDSATVEFAAKTRHADDGNYFSMIVGQDGSNDTSTNGQNVNKYLMFYSSQTTVKGVISDNNWGNEQGAEVEVANNNNVWHNYKLVVDGTKLAVFRDNALIIYNGNTGIKMSDLGDTTTYIGKSFYANDKYWNGAIDDLKVYKGADLKLADKVAISGDAVNNGSLKMQVGDTAQLKATVTPSDAVNTTAQWSSSNEKFVKVDANGKVTAVANGTADITAAAGEVSDKVTVTVTDLTDQDKAQKAADKAANALKSPADENLPFVVAGDYDAKLSWKSANEKVITSTDADYKNDTAGMDDPYQGGGVITRPAYGNGNTAPVKVTVTAKVGEVTATASKDVVVKEKTRVVPDAAYAAVTFLSDAATTNGKIGEALYMSTTKGNDFFSFSEINNGDPVIVSHSDTKGLRDPYVLKSHDGDKYYMIATDLKVSAQGWGQNQQYGSLKLEAWESTDLVNWTRTNAEDGDTGIKVNADNMGMTWAPEAFWDDATQSYVVFWSSREYTDSTRKTAVKSSKTNKAYNIVMMATTRDFKTFTPAQKWQDTQYSRIDSSVFKIGDYYYRLTKNEEGGAAGDYIKNGKSTFLERSKTLTATTTSSDPNADETKTWKLLDQNILPFEGPESIKLNPGDPNQNEKGDAMIIMADSGGYKPFMTSESDLASHDWFNRLSQTKDWYNEKQWGPGVTGKVTPTNMPTPTRHGAFVNVPAAVSENMHKWTTANPTTIPAVDSTTKVTYDAKSRMATATVAAADKGTVAGSVKFTVGDWTSEAVKLNADGVAQVTVPNSVSGTAVEAAYDGYTDGLVNGSEGTLDLSETPIEVVKPIEPTDPDDGDKTPETPDDDEQPEAPSGDKKPGDGADADDNASDKMPQTGAAAAGTVAAMALLAAAGVGLTVWRKRRA